MSAPADYTRLEQKLGYTFEDSALLEIALTHKSFVNENPELERTDNERLEFLGDSVLDLCVGTMLMEQFPDLREGELSMTRAQIVSEQGLTKVARALDLGDFLSLGKGEEQTGGRDKPSLLSDAFEAVMAAVYLDSGYDAASDVVRHLFADIMRTVEVGAPGFFDFKTRMQERAQALYKQTPHYEVINEYGPDHDKTFVVAVILNGRLFARGIGKSKKEAEREAAASALFLLDGADLDLLRKDDNK